MSRSKGAGTATAISMCRIRTAPSSRPTRASWPRRRSHGDRGPARFQGLSASWWGRAMEVARSGRARNAAFQAASVKRAGKGRPCGLDPGE